MSLRLFAALRPPAEVRATLLGLMGGVPEARWQTDAQLHLTLAFIGEVDRRRAEDVACALAGLRAGAFEASLGDFGSFENGRGRVQSLWIAARPEPLMAGLAASVSRTLLAAGVPLPTRRFVPHVTLARFPARGVAPATLGRFLSHHPSPAARWPVTEVHLMESRLGNEGSHYQSLMRVPLAAAAAA